MLLILPLLALRLHLRLEFHRSYRKISQFFHLFTLKGTNFRFNSKLTMAYLLVYLIFLGFALRNIVNADCGCGPKCVIFTDDMKCARCCTMSVKRRSLSSVSISQEENILTEKVDQKMKQVNFSAIFKNFNVLHYFSRNFQKFMTFLISASIFASVISERLPYSHVAARNL